MSTYRNLIKSIYKNYDYIYIRYINYLNVNGKCDKHIYETVDFIPNIKENRKLITKVMPSYKYPKNINKIKYEDQYETRDF